MEIVIKNGDSNEFLLWAFVLWWYWGLNWGPHAHLLFVGVYFRQKIRITKSITKLVISKGSISVGPKALEKPAFSVGTCLSGSLGVWSVQVWKEWLGLLNCTEWLALGIYILSGRLKLIESRRRVFMLPPPSRNRELAWETTFDQVWTTYLAVKNNFWKSVF